MSNYIEYNDKVAFHPGYYIQEIIEDSGLTQDDFARRLNTTAKNLSLLIRGEQSLSVDIAVKLSRMLGSSVEYWLNLQNAFDCLCMEIEYEEELKEEKEILKVLGYRYFRDYFHLPDLPRKLEEQVRVVREFLKVSTLTVLKNPAIGVSFRSAKGFSNDNVIRANAMVQIAINNAAGGSAPKYNRKAFQAAAERALGLTERHDEFYPIIKHDFYQAGVLLEILPNIKGSKINGACKKVGKNVVLMLNDRRLYSDTFWFTLYHEIGHILNGDYGASFEVTDHREDSADQYAADMLIPPEQYEVFLSKNDFSKKAICDFAYEIHRDPGIVIGRLQHEERIGHDVSGLQALRYKYYIKGISCQKEYLRESIEEKS